MQYYSENDEFHYFCHGLGGLVAAERQSGMLELCRKKSPTLKCYAGTMPDAFFNYLKLGWPKNLPKALK